ncbi:MAG: restriction endonuclease subunit S [Bacteroidota bacterium]
MVTELKDSGIEWIGMIPEGWKVKKLRYYCEIRNGDFISDNIIEDGKYPIIGGNGIMGYTDDFNHSGVALIIGRVGAYCGCVHIVNDQLWVSDNALILKTNLDALFLKYFLDSLDLNAQANKTAQPIITSTKIKSNYIVIPHAIEQKLISAYLNKTTTIIDKAVSVKKEQLKKLEELKKSIIYKAVTKGLDDTVKMKDSGIEWIGEIPEGWEVKRIKDNFKLQSGENLTSEQIQKDGLFPVLGGNGLRGYYSEYNNAGEYLLIGRQGALCGNINYIKGKFWAIEHAIVCYPIRQYAIFWLEGLLITMNLNQYSNAAAQPGISVDTIKKLYIPIPCYEEQMNIATFLDQKTSEIDSASEKITLQIEKLEDYKKSLIHECVTGKRRITENDIPEAV